MSEEGNPECQLRKRRSMEARPSLPLNSETGYRVNEGSVIKGTPSPSSATVDFSPSTRDAGPSKALLEFRKKQQSFEIQIEECDEEEIEIESEEECLDVTTNAERPITPTPIQDFPASVKYTEGPQPMDYLLLKATDNECITDVSEAESDEDS